MNCWPRHLRDPRTSLPQNGFKNKLLRVEIITIPMKTKKKKKKHRPTMDCYPSLTANLFKEEKMQLDNYIFVSSPILLHHNLLPDIYFYSLVFFLFLPGGSYNWLYIHMKLEMMMTMTSVLCFSALPVVSTSHSLSLLLSPLCLLHSPQPALDLTLSLHIRSSPYLILFPLHLLFTPLPLHHFYLHLVFLLIPFPAPAITSCLVSAVYKTCRDVANLWTVSKRMWIIGLTPGEVLAAWLPGCLTLHSAQWFEISRRSRHHFASFAS